MSNDLSTQPGVGLEVHGLRKSYNGREVLKGLDFRVEPGEIFVIIGPSGSGKSVPLKHRIGLEVPDAGEILIDGQPMHSPECLGRYRVAIVFQSGALFDSMTVAENVGFYLAVYCLKPPAEIAPIVAKTLELVGLEGTEDKMPGELSGGMKTRVAIARSLVIEPQLMFYDEPTSSLDPLSSVAIAEVIVGLNHRIHVTSVLVTHDRELDLDIANHIAVINKGRIVAIGTPDQIRRNPDSWLNGFLNANFAHCENTPQTFPPIGTKERAQL